jgi:hypothetical protein
MHEDPGTVRDSRVSGYLAKTAGPDELRRALNASARGTDNIVVEVPRQTLLGLSDGAAKVIHTLTAREREILTYSPPRRGRASDCMIRDFHVRASEQVESGPGSGHSFATGLLWVGARHCEQPRQRVLDRVDPYRMSATSSALASVSSQTSRRSTRSSSSLGRQATSFIASRWRWSQVDGEPVVRRRHLSALGARWHPWGRGRVEPTHRQTPFDRDLAGRFVGSSHRAGDVDVRGSEVAAMGEQQRRAANDVEAHACSAVEEPGVEFVEQVDDRARVKFLNGPGDQRGSGNSPRAQTAHCQGRLTRQRARTRPGECSSRPASSGSPGGPDSRRSGLWRGSTPRRGVRREPTTARGDPPR